METQIKNKILPKRLLIAEKKNRFEAMLNEVDALDDNELFYEAKKKINTTKLSS